MLNGFSFSTVFTRPLQRTPRNPQYFYYLYYTAISYSGVFYTAFCFSTSIVYACGSIQCVATIASPGPVISLVVFTACFSHIHFFVSAQRLGSKLLVYVTCV